MQFELTASMMCADFGNLKEEVRNLTEGGIDSFHIDIMDGRYVPNFAMSLNDMAYIASVVKKPLDVHLMIEQPERYIEEFVKCGADSITVHAEATKHLHRAVQQIKACGVKAGVALNPSTPLSVLDYVLEDTDMILLMTVNPGFGGQKYIPQMTGKIRTLRQNLIGRGLETDIQVDGGVNADTIREVLGAGANICVAGSAVFGDKTAEKTREFVKIMSEYTAFE